MKKFISSIALMGLAVMAYGQNSAIYKAQGHLDKSEFKEAAEILEGAMSNPKTTKFAEIYNMAGKAEAQIFNPELLKAAQNVPFDTTLFVTALDKSITYYTKSHEYDIKPNEKGKVKSKFIADNHRMIASMLDYYNYAGMFMYANHKLDKSLEYFGKYINMPKNPVFSKAETDSIYAAKHKEYAQAAFNVTMLNYQNKNWDGVIASSELALKDTAGLRDLYIMKAQAYLQKKDSVNWLNTLKEATARVNDAEGFAQELLSYYYNKNNAKEAAATADELLAMNPNSKASWYMKGCVELALVKNYVEARNCFKKALAIDPNFVEANVNMAVSYINEVVSRRDKGEFCMDRRKVDKFNADRKKIQVYYREALPFMEKVQQLVPENSKLWASYLQTIYYNLDNKAKSAEMDEIMKQAAAGK